jgi:hypothetical protein
MGECILKFEQIEIQNKKSDTDHSDNDWLSIAWLVDHRDGSQPVLLQQTVPLVNKDGSTVLDSGNVIKPIEQSVPCTDTDLVTAVYTITNLGSVNLEDQAKAASQVTQGIARAVADKYLDIAEVVLQYLPFLGANPTAVMVGDALAKALEHLHGPLLDLLDTVFEHVITPLIGEIVDKIANLLGHPNCSGLVVRDVAVFPPTTQDLKRSTSVQIYEGPQPNSSCGDPPHTRVYLVQDRNLDVFIGTFAKTPANFHPLWIYLENTAGDLMWYRQDTNATNWQGPKKVGSGWSQFIEIVPAGGNILYGISGDGSLKWYRHGGFNDGSVSWEGPVTVGSGWQDFQRVFSGSDGVLYAVQKDGTLLWYRNEAYDGPTPGGSWKGPSKVGSGWAGFRRVFSMGKGIIYAVKPDGELLWYRHDGVTNGAVAWGGPHSVGSGWNVFRDILPAGDGIVVGIRPDGHMFWYRHTDWETGVTLVPGKNKWALSSSAHWEGPFQIGSGWQGYSEVTALLPVTAPSQPH